MIYRSKIRHSLFKTCNNWTIRVFITDSIDNCFYFRALYSRKLTNPANKLLKLGAVFCYFCLFIHWLTVLYSNIKN